MGAERRAGDIARFRAEEHQAASEACAGGRGRCTAPEYLDTHHTRALSSLLPSRTSLLPSPRHRETRRSRPKYNLWNKRQENAREVVLLRKDVVCVQEALPVSPVRYQFAITLPLYPTRHQCANTMPLYPVRSSLPDAARVPADGALATRDDQRYASIDGSSR